MAVSCLVCSSETSKYKCSKCLSPYCSLQCWNVHKDSVSCGEEVMKLVSKQECQSSDEYLEYMTEDTVLVTKLKELEHSKHLKEMLRNPDLRKMLKAVDSSVNATKLVHQAMLDPTFVEFADECLKIVDDTTHS